MILEFGTENERMNKKLIWKKTESKGTINKSINLKTGPMNKRNKKDETK